MRKDVVELDLVLVLVQESVFGSGHLQAKLFVFSFPLVNVLEGATDSGRGSLLHAKRGIDLDTLELFGRNFFLLGFGGIVFGFTGHI